MKKVRMIIKKTTAHRVECELIDSVANRLIVDNEDVTYDICHALASDDNKTHCSYEIEDLEVME